MSRKFLVVSALVLASALTACGGGDDKNDENKKKQAELRAWAAKVCAVDVTARIDEARVALADVGKVIPNEQPATLRTRLAADISRLADADNALADAIDKAGIPAVSDGAALRTSVVEELRHTAKGWAGIQTKVEGLATDKQNVFADGLRSLNPEIDGLRASSHTALGKLHRGDAGKALAAVPGCAAGKPDAIPTAPVTSAPTTSPTPAAGASSAPPSKSAPPSASSTGSTAPGSPPPSAGAESSSAPPTTTAPAG
ncbi:hypothetical protein [Embleya scabrispora]|uniref:hypothetical protein n=1 Tax=Embleya scabrispora TaxID=159449 RepID=UPI00037A46A2|nr:hypothetical protein [Embleya scabrispora]MYS81203.1 hypothetical protein [Streptomyces sp. SID5474]